MTVRISLYDPTVTYPGQKRFDCGNDAIDKFAHDSLKAQVRKSLSAAYVLTDMMQQIVQGTAPAQAVTAAHAKMVQIFAQQCLPQ